jgi:Rrf2 family protein
VHVNLTAQYALRVMMHLASRGADGPSRARDLSRSTGVPVAYLSKVLRRLVKGGLLHAQKGHGGGFVLARRRDRIRLMDVITSVGGVIERDLCILGGGRCVAADPCALHDSWSELNNTFLAWSRRTTLATLQETPARRASRPGAKHSRGGRPRRRRSRS